jgi:ankyrin repeat protein
MRIDCLFFFSTVGDRISQSGMEATEYHHIGTPRDNEWELVVNSENKALVYYINSDNIAKYIQERCSSPFEAVLAGDMEWVEMYVSCGGDYDVVSGPEGYTLAHYAVAANKPEIIELLLDKMKNFHQCDSSHVCPLAIAAKYGHLELVRLLISNGANVRITDSLGNTVLHVSAEFGQTHCVKFFLSLFTSDRYRERLCGMIGMKNVNKQTAYDVALRGGYSDIAALILTTR